MTDINDVIAKVQSLRSEDGESPVLDAIMAATSGDAVNSPSHYKHGRIETIEAIEDWNMGYHLGNVIKYVSRAGRKGDRIEDLRKARWYLDREIERSTRDRVKGERRVGDTIRCTVGEDTDCLVEGREYQIAAVQNGHDFSFVALAELPARYWDAARFELVNP